MVQELLTKYIWLIDTFVRAGERGLDIETVATKWENRFDAPLARRSFINHRAAIEEIFNITIECNRSTNRYFIRYVDDVTDSEASAAWLVNTFTVNNLLRLATERLSGRVAVEDIPSGRKWLAPVIDALLENRVLRIHYQKYTSDSGADYTLRPYAIKEYAKRWYLVAYCIEKEEVRIYGLDRITFLESTIMTFKMPKGFDVDQLFAHSFGIYLSYDKPCTITFRTTKWQAKYLVDLPLHPSQQIVSEDGDWVTFTIFAQINSQLITALLRYGSAIEVLSPSNLRSAFIDELRATSALYGI